MWRNYLMRAVVVACLLLLGWGGWWLYDLGKLTGVEELGTLRSKHLALDKKYRRLAGENTTLREQLAILERSSQIDRQAASDVKTELGRLEEDLQAAREEIAFYRGIVAPGDAQSGLRIHRFHLTDGNGAGQYHYELVLTQLRHNERYVSGVVDWQIHGSLLGEPGVLALAGVTSPAIRRLEFRFRYFQELTGVITLPEGFEAKTVELSVKPSGKNQPGPVVQVFDWPGPEA
ncbi:MAG: hypothetical protein PVJ66_04705 [Gammaproteobacteria bacterium]|jgi:hypothetical protein